MNRFVFAVAVAAVTAPVLAADVGVSVQVGEPGFYGRIDIGNVPQPRLVYPAPVLIQRVPAGAVREPIYLHVPPGHEKNWRKHCRKYNACGRPVYFVRNDWYRHEYVPRYREREGNEHRERRGDHRGRDWERHGDHRGQDWERHGDHRGQDWERHGDHRGQGHDQDHGKGKGRKGD